MSAHRSHSGASGPDVRRPYGAGHLTTPPIQSKPKSRPGHPDLGPDEPERPLLDAAEPPRRRRLPTHPDLDRPDAAGPLTDILGTSLARILRRFSGVFRVEVQGTICPVHLVVADDRSGFAPPRALTWEIEEPRDDGLTQVVSVSAPVGLTPECSCSEFDRDWDCRHLRALQRIGILGNPNHLDDDCACDCRSEAPETEGGASC